MTTKSAILLVLIIFGLHSCNWNSKDLDPPMDPPDPLPPEILQALEDAQSGDSVQIPPGTYGVEGNFQLEGGITITGSGMNETILQRTDDLEQAFFRVDGSNGLPVQISDMKLIGDRQSGSDRMDTGIELANSCQDFRINNMVFESLGRAGVLVNGTDSRGVIDNCRFVYIYRPAIANFGYGVSVNGDGDDGWEDPLVLGDDNAVFIEDCYFIGNRHAVASINGSRYVFRHNLVEDNGGEEAWVQAVDAHGPGYGSPRGSRSYEVYGNIINNANTTCWVAMYIRGGDGVIFDNAIYGGIGTAPIMLYNDSGFDTYPVLDQIRELYLWDNTFEDEPSVPTNWSPRDPEDIREETRVVQEGRDYFNFERPGYNPYIYPHPLRGD